MLSYLVGFRVFLFLFFFLVLGGYGEAEVKEGKEDAEHIRDIQMR